MAKNIHAINEKNAGILHQRINSLEKIGLKLFDDHSPSRFVLSGGSERARHEVLIPMLSYCMGKIPVIVVHGSTHIPSAVHFAWEKFAEKTLSDGHNDFWYRASAPDRRDYEPFYNMPPQAVLAIIKELIKRDGQALNSGFDTVIKAYLNIISQFGQPISLSILKYLCEFDPTSAEFYSNIMQLNCSPAQKQSIWTDISNNPNETRQFASFIDSFSAEAAYNGWDSENSSSTDVNIFSAVENRGCLVLSVDQQNSTMFIPYLMQELKYCSSKPMVILFDELIINDDIAAYLQAANPCVFYGIIGNSVPGQFLDENKFRNISSKTNRLVMLKHSTNYAALAFSEAIGKYDRIMQSSNSGQGRSAFHIFPRNYHDGVTEQIQSDYRVPPVDITSLGDYQAIMLDEDTDEIVYYNI